MAQSRVLVWDRLSEACVEASYEFHEEEHIYSSKDFGALSKLRARVPLYDTTGHPLLDGAGEPRTSDFFATENPEWQAEGIVVHGKNGLLTRMSFHTRRTMASILRKQLGL